MIPYIYIYIYICIYTHANVLYHKQDPRQDAAVGLADALGERRELRCRHLRLVIQYDNSSNISSIYYMLVVIIVVIYYIVVYNIIVVNISVILVVHM